MTKIEDRIVEPVVYQNKFNAYESILIHQLVARSVYGQVHNGIWPFVIPVVSTPVR